MAGKEWWKMSPLIRKIDEYLSLRRIFGTKLKGAEVPLRKFVAFLQTVGTRFVTTARALEWASQPQGISAYQRAARLRAVRFFAAYLHAADSRHEVPPANLLDGRTYRTRPYIYSKSEINALLQAARALPSPRNLRGATYATILGLLAVTGMRRSEGVALDRADVDLAAGVLTVRKTKFGKTRLIPLHPTTTQALRTYARHRDRVVPVALSDGFFLNESGTRLTGWALQYTWVKLTRQVGLRGPRDRRGPRMHDLRHRFAVESLLRWYQRDLDAARRLPVLSTYLGHVHVADTYWYLEAIPALLELATRRLDHPTEGRL
jgi:integrase